MPPLWRRLLCRALGHRWTVAGVEGLNEFSCCTTCGKIGRKLC